MEKKQLIFTFMQKLSLIYPSDFSSFFFHSIIRGYTMKDMLHRIPTPGTGDVSPEKVVM
jgi:hypothetical protein